MFLILLYFIFLLLTSFISGVSLKWLSPDHIYIDNNGKLLLGSLAGAVITNTAATSTDAMNYSEVSSIATLSREILATETTTTMMIGRNNHSDTNGDDDEEEEEEVDRHHKRHKIDKSRRKDKREHKQHRSHRSFLLRAIDGDDAIKVDHKRKHDHSHSNTAKNEPTIDEKQLKKEAQMARNLMLPSSTLHTIAPEVILGAAASAQSTIYTVGAICVLLLTGKPLIKVKRKKCSFINVRGCVFS